MKANYLGAAAAVLWLSGCMGVPYYISDAPGCSRWIGGSVGGCRGITVIRDIEFTPAGDCLKIEANNCNGGMLEVRNTCGLPLVFGEWHDLDDLDVVKGDNDEWLAVSSDGNFSRETVAEDTRITLNGTLGDQALSLSFTKTAPLCSRD